MNAMLSHFKPMILATMSIGIAQINEVAGCIGIVASAIYACIKLYKELKK